MMASQKRREVGISAARPARKAAGGGLKKEETR